MISKHNRVKYSQVIVYKINKNANLMNDIWPEIQENDKMCLSPKVIRYFRKNLIFQKSSPLKFDLAENNI